MTILDEQNIEVLNIKEIFDAINPIPYQLQYDSFPDPDGIPLVTTIRSHFKGVAAYWDKFILTYTNLDSLENNGVYMIAPKELATSGEIKKIRGNWNCGPTEMQFCNLCPDKEVCKSPIHTNVVKYPTDHEGWLHPCGIQVCGSYLAMGIQQNALSCNESEIRIYGINSTRSLGEFVHLGTIARCNKRVNGVAMTKLKGSDGKYIIAGADDGLTLYISDGPSLIKNDGSLCDFTPIEVPSYDGCSNGISFVTEQGGDTYIISMDANDDGSNNIVCLYQLNDLDSLPKCTKVAQKELTIPAGMPYLQASLRWGKGVFINTSVSIQIYACSRNVFDNQLTILGWSNY